MKAYHINWTKPFLELSPNTPYAIPDYALLTTILSAACLQQNSGPVQMITDRAGAAYYRSIGLDRLWHGGMLDPLDQWIPACVNPICFWAAGKLYTLLHKTAPCLIVDTDFIIWKNISGLLSGCKIAAIHDEPLSPEVYPPFSALQTNFSMHSNFDLTLRPANTALLYFQDTDFMHDYAKTAISFLEQTPSPDNRLTYMVFAEQRLLPLCAKQAHIPIRYLRSFSQLFSNEEQTFTHVWGHKTVLEASASIRADFCAACVRRILADFPAYGPMLYAVPSLQVYL